MAGAPGGGGGAAAGVTGREDGRPEEGGLEEVRVFELDPERFATVLDGGEWTAFQDAIRRGRELFAERTLWNVNSTAHGGGVAELLRSLIGYARGAELDARWAVIDGDADFFRVTKRIHNLLHGFRGDGGPLDEVERAIYDRRCERNAELLTARLRPQDAVILHDPQTAGMVPHLARSGAAVVWRAHVGADEPNDLAREAWRFLTPYIEPADAFIFSSARYVWEGLDRDKVSVIAPSIDAFSPKNQTLTFTGVTAVLRAVGLARDGHHASRAVFERLDGSVCPVTSQATVLEEQQLRLDEPLLTQVSRWDRLKDPTGVLAAFVEHVRFAEDPHLLLAGPDVTSVTDDPEGQEVFRESEAAWLGLPRAARRRVHLALLPMNDADENAVIVNAVQRRSDVICQKSLAEGFGLTVSEAMWKARPVVASDVGGIREQIEDGRSGFLVDPRDLASFGRHVSDLLADPHDAERMGEAGQARVREHFLGPRHFEQYLVLFEKIFGSGS
ncbi:MAG TPA: glycosyltransferase [Solirubrobacteraceae bacterium]|nr:glycosyltransferase [Solirubrobacteraceae bacterium]